MRKGIHYMLLAAAIIFSACASMSFAVSSDSLAMPADEVLMQGSFDAPLIVGLSGGADLPDNYMRPERSINADRQAKLPEEKLTDNVTVAITHAKFLPLGGAVAYGAATRPIGDG